MRIWEMDPEGLPPDVAARMDRALTGDPHDHTEMRSPFEQDRDRILYSAAFRRLGGVTQIAAANEGHVFHNRLTHTLKVAQTGRRLAQYLRREYINQHGEEAFLEDVGHLDPDVVETACLAHDLGHPPFGHVAEDALDRMIREDPFRVEDGFEGNPQSFRILSRVAVKAGVARGLDLTRAALNAVLKYPWGRGQPGTDRHRKWGYFSQDGADFDFAREHMPDGYDRPCLEAQVMDWADEVTYAVHDVDDFYRAGFIPLDQIVQDTKERQEFLEHPRVRALFDGGGFDEATAVEFLKDLDQRDAFFPPSLKVRFTGSRVQRCDLQRFSSSLLTRFLAVEPGPAEVAHLLIDTSGPEPTLRKDPQLAFEVKLLKKLADVYVFGAPTLLAQQEGQRRVVRGLFKAFHEATESDEGKRNLLPAHLRDMLRRIEETAPGLDDLRMARVRIAADAVASLNENQAVALYETLGGTGRRSVRSGLLR